MKVKNKIYIIAAVFLIISLSLAMFFVFPFIADIQSDSAQIVYDKNEVSLISAESRQIEIFKKRYEEHKPNFQKADRLFVDLENPIDFIEFLEKTSQGAKVSSVISLAPLPKGKVAGSSMANFQVSSKGFFKNVLSFADKLESSNYLIAIKSLSITSVESQHIKKEKEDLTQVNANFLIEAVTK